MYVCLCAHIIDCRWLFLCGFVCVCVCVYIEVSVCALWVQVKLCVHVCGTLSPCHVTFHLLVWWWLECSAPEFDSGLDSTLRSIARGPLMTFELKRVAGSM